ncbi:shikimate dehydrogenase family protein [Mycolicibacterium komossense]|uniref:Shikimate dehydrogenase n=1 Tax=Mycolicibacterium komossense TaxID=1779 RepID=A0ABT3CBU9_9MYCO|nr:hypothetical protein [Mycolicibacterium komossense]MCV7226726.1 shikimate dehydrogenase [Mycolicibacterium komossense]
MSLPPPAQKPTMYFVGVTTGASSIMKVFPAWARHLGIDAHITGIDLPLDAEPEAYRKVVSFIKNDPLSLGALVTTHKLNLYQAARDLFDEAGDATALLGEVSSISKRGTTLRAQAMDPLTSGLSLEAIVAENYWRDGAELLLLGAGGSALALTLYLHRRQQRGDDTPSRIVVTNRRPGRLEEMRAIHDRLATELKFDYVHAASATDNDRQLADLAPGSIVVNATGLGKDRPGSPLGAAAVFPQQSIAWDFNYRGDLLFLDQARAQSDTRGVRAEDGWVYFLHGWTRVISDVFDVEIPMAGPEFDAFADIARTTTTTEKG